MDLVASEIESLRALRHPHIVEYLGTEKEDNTLRIFLEYALSLSLSLMLLTVVPASEAVN
jgi:serine/threonine protein kinase